MKFTKINSNLFQIILPYKDIFTTIYLIKTEKGALIFDVATFRQDITEGLLPAMAQAGISKEDVKYAFISHNHRDHAGALPFFFEVFPEVTVLNRSPALKEKYEGYKVYSPEEGEVFLDVLRVVTIPGHTKDSAALLDTRTNTLITGDCLQQYGIFGSEDWGSNIPHPALQLKAVKKVREMKVDAIYSAHDYHPCGQIALGNEAVEKVLSSCEEPLYTVKQMILDHPEMDDVALRALYNASGNIPTLKTSVIAAMRSAIREKTV
jgi:glyoxylase-like metal-dependent hydrolase (beta-lactamase superfamily II)